MPPIPFRIPIASQIIVAQSVGRYRERKVELGLTKLINQQREHLLPCYPDFFAVYRCFGLLGFSGMERTNIPFFTRGVT